MKVVIARETSSEIRKLIAAHFPQEWEIVTAGKNELINAAADADVIIPEGAAIDGRLLKRCKKLKLIQTGAGYDNVDIRACSERGIYVANAAGIDVFETGPLPESGPLPEMDNLILSPHTAGEPQGPVYPKNRYQFFAENIQRVFNGQAPQNALNEIPVSGAEPEKLIPEVILPEGYKGKILLVSVSGDRIDKTVLLRSGDLWHREILRNTETEIKNLGYEKAKIYALGGARVSFEPDGSIAIYGTSDEFGTCDKNFAAEMIKKVFPNREVTVRD